MKLSQQDFLSLTLDKNPVEWFRSVLKTPSNPKNPYAKSVQILTNDFKIFKIRDLVNHWQGQSWDKIEEQLTESNWMYAYCVRYRYRLGLTVPEINIYFAKPKQSVEDARRSLEGLPEMSDSEVAKFLMENPIEVKGAKVMNGFHRVSAMIGRLINGQKYIPIG